VTRCLEGRVAVGEENWGCAIEQGEEERWKGEVCKDNKGFLREQASERGASVSPYPKETRSSRNLGYTHLHVPPRNPPIPFLLKPHKPIEPLPPSLVPPAILVCLSAVPDVRTGTRRRERVLVRDIQEALLDRRDVEAG
jgi:hypothetical protein